MEWLRISNMSIRSDTDFALVHAMELLERKSDSPAGEIRSSGCRSRRFDFPSRTSHPSCSFGDKTPKVGSCQYAKGSSMQIRETQSVSVPGINARNSIASNA